MQLAVAAFDTEASPIGLKHLFRRQVVGAVQRLGEVAHAFSLEPIAPVLAGNHDIGRVTTGGVAEPVACAIPAAPLTQSLDAFCAALRNRNDVWHAASA